MIYLLIAVVIFTAEYFIKEYIEKKKVIGKSETILKDKVIITKYHNYGAFLNLLEKRREVLLFISGLMVGAVSLLMIVFLPQKGKCLLKTSIALLAGGAASNVYDRIKRGYVVDYFSFSFLRKIVLNISDLFIFIGSIIVTVYLLCTKDEL